MIRFRFFFSNFFFLFFLTFVFFDGFSFLLKTKKSFFLNFRFFFFLMNIFPKIGILLKNWCTPGKWFDPNFLHIDPILLVPKPFWRGNRPLSIGFGAGKIGSIWRKLWAKQNWVPNHTIWWGGSLKNHEN